MGQEQARASAIEGTLEEIREIEASQGVTRESLEAIKSALLGLAARKDLFDAAAFPPPSEGGDRLYTLSIDQDQRFALYLDCCDEETQTPPHNHTTWAVIVGVEGAELNRFYADSGNASGDGRGPLAQTHEFRVEPGNGVAMLPDDFHSIHVEGGRVNMNLHMYGLALPELTDRVMYDFETGQYGYFAPHPDAQ